MAERLNRPLAPQPGGERRVAVGSNLDASLQDIGLRVEPAQRTEILAQAERLAGLVKLLETYRNDGRAGSGLSV